MTLHCALFYEPGHFHVALTLRTSNPRLAPDIHIYATPGPRFAMDLMTGPHSLRAQLIGQVLHTPELFGTFVTPEGVEPAIDLASVHHLYEQVNGQPL